MANINATVVVFEHGGVITIGSDTVLNVEKGTLRFSPGLWENKEYTDRGVIKDPLQGDALPTDVEFDVKATSGAASSEIYELMVTTGSSGIRKQYSIVVKVPDSASAVTGDQWTFSKCVPVACEFQAGAQFDTFKLRFRDQENAPARAAY